MIAHYTPQRIETIRKNGPFLYLKTQVPVDSSESSEVRLWQSVLNWALADYLSGVPLNEGNPEIESSWEEYLSEDNYDFGAVCDRARFSVPFVMSVFQKMKERNPYLKETANKKSRIPTGKTTKVNLNSKSAST